MEGDRQYRVIVGREDADARPVVSDDRLARLALISHSPTSLEASEGVGNVVSAYRPATRRAGDLEIRRKLRLSREERCVSTEALTAKRARK
jgi:hypothetical protein